MIVRLRRFAVVVIVLYAALFVQLNVVQLARGEEYRESPLNTRPVVRAFTQPRGPILTAEGEVMAETVEVDDELERLRSYPAADLYAHVTGFLSLNFGASGLERVRNEELAGQTFAQRITGLGDLFSDEVRTATVTTTIRADVQRAARDALGGRRGSVVALDPRTGAVLALWSFPSYDPNRLSSHDLDAVAAARAELLDDDQRPLLARSYQEIFFPGSTFKVVTAAAALESATATPSEPVFAVTDAYVPPQTTRPIRNFGGSTCGGDLVEALRVSCNTAFAELGVLIGAPALVDRAEAVGFNSVPPFDLPGAVASNMPPASAFDDAVPLLAQSAIGQFEVQATPLQMALTAAAVARDGTVPRPYVVAEVESTDGTILDRGDPSVWRRAFSPTTAATLRELMAVVATDGTARRMLPEGVTGGGKTGTAQLASGDDATHAWIVGFAPLEAPEVAVAVIVEGRPGEPEATGGEDAAPVAAAVITAALAGGG